MDAPKSAQDVETAIRTWLTPAKRRFRRLQRHLQSRRMVVAPRPRARPDWFVAPADVPDPGIVLLGVAKSGTTMVRVLLDAHPGIACGPESGLFLPTLDERRLERLGIPAPRLRAIEAQSSCHAEFAAGVMRQYAQAAGKDRWAEKTPRNLYNMGWILDRFPNVQLVHVVRDGRAVVNSLRTHPKYVVRRGTRVPTGIDNPLDVCIDRWRQEIARVAEYESHPRVSVLRYEDVAADPESALTPILGRVGLDWAEQIRQQAAQGSAPRPARSMITSPNATAPVDPERTQAWRTELDRAQIDVIDHELGQLLERYGYD